MYELKGACMKDYYLTPNGHFWQLYRGNNKLNFDEMIMSALYWTNTLSYICYSGNSLKPQYVGRHVTQLGHIILIQSHSNLCSYSLYLCA